MIICFIINNQQFITSLYSVMIIGLEFEIFFSLAQEREEGRGGGNRKEPNQTIFPEQSEFDTFTVIDCPIIHIFRVYTCVKG